MMSDLLSTFRRRAQELIDAINGSGGLRATVDGLRRQMAESDRRRTIQKARSDLRSMDRQIDEMITAVGVQAVGLHRAGRLTAPELAPLAAHVIELRFKISFQRLQITRPAGRTPDAVDFQPDLPKTKFGKIRIEQADHFRGRLDRDLEIFG